MRAQWCTRRRSPTALLTGGFRRAVVGLVVVAWLVAWPGSVPAQGADARVEKAQSARQQAQQRLDAVLARVREVEASVASAEAELEQLTSREQAYRADADAARNTVAQLARASYQYGTADPALVLFASASPGQALEQVRMLGLVARRSQAGYESASAARVRTHVVADAAQEAAERLQRRRAELEAARSEAAGLLATAEQRERVARQVVAGEQAEQRAAQRRRRSQQEPRASRAAPELANTAPAGGGVACPVGQPRSYSDTYGAPRSGGRSHKGTDILAPRGTPIYAYEDGTVSRMSSNRLGGISLYLRGSSGVRYYYTHLQGYVGGLSVGQQVEAGQHLAANGDTGNARGIPHLHFEVMPGGGGNVNPYPYVRRACG